MTGGNVSKWLKGSLIALAVLIAGVAVLPFFLSLDDYIPRIEEDLSARLKEPVSIGSIRFAALPTPHVTLDGIQVGKTGDLKLGKMTVTPDLFSLLRSTRVIRSIEIDSLALTQKAIDRLPAWAAPDAGEPPPARVESVRLTNALLSMGKSNFGPFDARFNLDLEGGLADATIAMRDGKFKALIKPDGPKYLVEASARSWTVPFGPALVFDELSVKGVATADNASFGEVSARLYGGTAAGKATIGWRKGLRLEGTLEVSQVETRQIASMLSPGTHVSGRLTAKPAFSAAAASADRLMNALRLESNFSVRDGAIHGVDIQKAATSLVKQGTSGGETRFQQLSGHVLMQHGAYRFTHLRIASGVLAAEGHVDVSPKQGLSGRINAKVSAMGASTSVPLNVAGTVDAPSLYPTGGTIAGAAVGTVILGPGFGTSVGAKIGGWAEGLFGGEGKQPAK